MSIESAEALLKQKWASKKDIADHIGVSLVSAGRYVRELGVLWGKSLRTSKVRQGERGPMTVMYTLRGAK